MLESFIIENRDAIITRARTRVAMRTSPKPSEEELRNGIPVFLDQLGDALRLAKWSATIDHKELDKSARRHGFNLLQLGLSVGQVVHDYGDVCQAITELAVEQNVSIPAEQFKTLNLCLDDAIAGAVSAFGKHRERAIEDAGGKRERAIADEANQRLGVLAHEMRNLLASATLAFESIKSGLVAPGGSTGGVLGRSLAGLSELIDRTLADVRLDAGIERLERISVADFLEEVEVGAILHARARDLHLEVRSADHGLMIEGDRQTLAAAVSNLLQNAFKFTHKGGKVTLTTRATADRVLFEIEDECGGLPAGKTEELFRPFRQRGADRSGIGLGLSICLRAAKANHGEIHVRDLPGKGCVFTLDLPRTPTVTRPDL